MLDILHARFGAHPDTSSEGLSQRLVGEIGCSPLAALMIGILRALVKTIVKSTNSGEQGSYCSSLGIRTLVLYI